MLSSETARKSVQTRLRTFTSAERSKLSLEVCSRFIEAFESAKIGTQPKCIALYRAFLLELDLRSLETYFFKKKVKLCYPRVLSNIEMELIEVPDPHLLDHWVTGPYGIEEPHPELKRVDLASVDCIFIPGMAFGLKGERVGRGKGHYDRFLSPVSQKSDLLRVALTFDFQLFPALEQKAWDQPMHWIMTEHREIRLPAAESWLERLASK